MPLESRCFTVRPTAATREGLSVLVIDSTVGEAEQVCAALREDGHATDARTYDDELLEIIAEQNPQVIAIRMRLVGAARSTRARIKKAFPHIRLISFSTATADEVRDQMPERWTELYELSPARMPNPVGFPRAVREVIEDLLSA
jgi:CheY-like chemotaxis protein